MLRRWILPLITLVVAWSALNTSGIAQVTNALLTNEDIIELERAGVGDEIILPENQKRAHEV